MGGATAIWLKIENGDSYGYCWSDHIEEDEVMLRVREYLGDETDLIVDYHIFWAGQGGFLG